MISNLRLVYLVWWFMHYPDTFVENFLYVYELTMLLVYVVIIGYKENLHLLI